MGPTLWEQAPKQARKCIRPLGAKPLSKQGSAPGLCVSCLKLTAWLWRRTIHRSGFAAPEIPQAAHMGQSLAQGRLLPKGISIPLYALRQRFITRSAFPVSSDATASMQADFGRVLPQTCADLYDKNRCLTTRNIEEAGFTNLLTPPEGRFSTPKGDIRIQTRPLTRLAEKPGSTMGGAGHKDRTCGKFCDFWLQFPTAYPASICWQRSYSYPTST
jgi:hypothetical protein